MANVKIAFFGSEKSDNIDSEIVCFANQNNEIFISITDTSVEHSYNQQIILLDRSTAIKLHRELKKQISFLESEVDNG